VKEDATASEGREASLGEGTVAVAVAIGPDGFIHPLCLLLLRDSAD